MTLPHIDLPDKPSELLRVAVRDAQAAEAAGHTLDMRGWVVPRIDGTCAVCMAGAVMLRAGEWRRAPFPLASPIDYDEVTHERLTSIDEMRVGDCTGVLPYGAGDVIRRFCEIVSADMNDDGLEYARASWDTYLRAADYLASEGY